LYRVLDQTLFGLDKFSRDPYWATIRDYGYLIYIWEEEEMKVEVWSGNEVFRPLNIMLEVLEANRGDGRIASIVIPVYKDATMTRGLSAGDALFLAIMNAQSVMEGL